MFIAQLIEKKIRSITFIVWVLGRVEKKALKKVKKFHGARAKKLEGGGRQTPPPAFIGLNKLKLIKDPTYWISMSSPNHFLST